MNHDDKSFFRKYSSVIKKYLILQTILIQSLNTDYNSQITIWYKITK